MPARKLLPMKADSSADRVPGERPTGERMPSDPDVLTAGQLAERLGFATNTVTALARSGALPGRRFGKEWRFWWPAVVAAMSESNPETPGQPGQPDEAPPSDIAEQPLNGSEDLSISE